MNDTRKNIILCVVTFLVGFALGVSITCGLRGIDIKRTDSIGREIERMAEYYQTFVRGSSELERQIRSNQAALDGTNRTIETIYITIDRGEQERTAIIDRSTTRLQKLQDDIGSVIEAGGD